MANTWSLAGQPAAIGATLEVAVAVCVVSTLIDRFTGDTSEVGWSSRACTRLRCRNTNIC